MLSNKYDFEILDYISKFNKVEEPQLLKIFQDSKFATKGRLKYLKSEKLIDKFPKMRVLDSSDNKPDYYVITEIGKRSVQNYIINQKELKKEFIKTIIIEFMRSIFCPIIVSVITTLITYWLITKLSLSISL